MTERPDDEATPQDTDSDWKAVEASGAGPHPPLPRRVVYGGLGLLALLIIGAVIAGIGLGGGFSGPTPQPSVSPTPQLTMEPPVQLGSYVRGELKKAEDGRLTRADYTDGTASIVLLMHWPQDDVSTFMSDAGFVSTSAPVATVGPTMTASPEPVTTLCGTSTDFSAQETLGCGGIVKNTGLMVVALSSQDEEEIRGLLEDFEQAVLG